MYHVFYIFILYDNLCKFFYFSPPVIMSCCFVSFVSFFFAFLWAEPRLFFIIICTIITSVMVICIHTTKNVKL